MANLQDTTVDGNLTVSGAQTYPTPSWTTLTLTNGWEAYGGDYAAPRYTKINGWVFVDGLVRNGTANTSIFTLPVGYRPPISLLFTQLAYPNAVYQARLFSSGTYIVYSADNTWESTCFNFFVGDD